MPIFLPPVSRRQFLASSLAAGLFGRSAIAAESDPHFWAFFSDTHIAEDRRLIFNKRTMADQLSIAVKDLIVLPAPPAGLIVDGDLAFKYGLRGDYAAFGELIKPVRSAGMPIHLTLGNHDDRETFFAGLADKAVRKPLAGRHVAMLKTPRANFVLLDSLDAVNKTPGVYGGEQLKWLANSLDANGDRPAIIVGHHNPGGLIDMDAFIEVIAARKQVKAYFFGHTHSWSVARHASGIHLVNLPAIAYPFDGASPTGWVKSWIEPAGMKLELRCIDATHKAHGEKHDLKWRAS